MDDLEARLWDLFGPYLAAEGIELDDLEVRGGGGARLVRVSLDAPGGMDVEAIARASQGLSRLLDQADALAGAYTLEVGSPGLERDLRRPAQFAKAVGREVVLTTRDPLAGSRRHRGVLDEVTDETVTLRLAEGTRHIPFGQVAQARTVFRWEKAPKPGHKRG
ncbi:MAG: ribosome maturation factor RimP [Acidimicrobiia bacterium]|nr:ribosome maturation factor RimP [Acidimicrobiia bacterium]